MNKREHYEGYRKNPNDKIYMVMNRKDVEAYQKSYEEIDIFLKQFPHLRHIVTGELKTKSDKSKDNWLLIKEKDDYVKDHDGISDLNTSIRSGRTIKEIEEGKEEKLTKNTFKAIN